MADIRPVRYQVIINWGLGGTQLAGLWRADLIFDVFKASYFYPGAYGSTQPSRLFVFSWLQNPLRCLIGQPVGGRAGGTHTKRGYPAWQGHSGSLGWLHGCLIILSRRVVLSQGVEQRAAPYSSRFPALPPPSLPQVFLNSLSSPSITMLGEL